MRAVLARAVRAAEVVAGSAEAMPLAAGSVDVVLAGQAFHWFEPDRAVPEIARVLRPGGVLALLYNSRDDGVAWVRALSDLVGELDRATTSAGCRPSAPPDLGAGLAFDAELRTPHEHELDAGRARRPGRVPQLRDPAPGGRRGRRCSTGSPSSPAATRSWSAGSTSGCRTSPASQRYELRS